MAKDFSFDVVSDYDVAEMQNAVDQAQRELGTRYDFKGTSASISELNRKDKELTLTATIVNGPVVTITATIDGASAM